jgi:hypothetical protein
MKTSLRRTVAIVTLVAALAPASAFCGTHRPAAASAGSRLMQQLASVINGLANMFSDFGISMDPNGGG